jgi:hypothetical protein
MNPGLSFLNSSGFIVLIRKMMFPWSLIANQKRKHYLLNNQDRIIDE